MKRLTLLLGAAYLLFACNRLQPETPTPATATLYFPDVNSTDWASTTPAALGWQTDKLSPLYSYLESTNTRAFLVLKDGKVVIEKYFGSTLLNTGTFGSQSQWYWASAGKTLTAFLVGKAQEEKLLALDQRTSVYLGTGWTSLPAAKENLITVRHQLMMTTGLDDNVPNNADTSPQSLIYKADAGTRWAYHNAPYTLLTQVVGSAARQPFERYFDAKLKNQIGMDGQWRDLGEEYVFFSTARSMARFGLLMLNQGNWNGQPILTDKAYLTACLTPSQAFNKSYGYLWWLNGQPSHMLPTLQTVISQPLASAAPADMVAAMGKNGQLLNVVPSKGIVVVRMGDSPDGSFVPTAYQNELWKRLSEVLN
jgi:CubicO group peptidase (beta-lactamase class C family)